MKPSFYIHIIWHSYSSTHLDSIPRNTYEENFFFKNLLGIFSCVCIVISPFLLNSLKEARGYLFFIINCQNYFFGRNCVHKIFSM